MSRVVAFDLHNRSTMEFQARGVYSWSLAGSITVQGGTQATIAIPDIIALDDRLQLGRMILTQPHPDLPYWAGMIDTPWVATLPVQMTVYSTEYLLALRVPDNPVTLTGSFESILREIIDRLNKLEDLYVRVGDMGNLPAGQQQLTLTQKPLWEQLNDFGKRENVEFLLRPEYVNKVLTIYIDASQEIGEDTGYLLHDGTNGNMRILSASVKGKIINRMIGIGRQDSSEARPQTQPFWAEDSIDVYRMRSAVVQFRTLTLLSSVEAATRKALAQAKQPKLSINVSITESAFPQTRPGNIYLVHAANLYLPGGVHGWRGEMRMTQMAYDEPSNTLGATLEADL